MQTIYLDISNKGVIPTIYAKQGDIGRKFQVVLTDSGLPYIPTGGSAFSVWYSGASGDGNYTDIGDKTAFTVIENKVVVEMISQMLSNDGDGVLSLVLNDPNGNQISTWNIPYICEYVPGADGEEAKAYYTAFSQAVENLPYPDASLSVPGKAADAAATGKALEGKAPAGYGLGEEIIPVSENEINNVGCSGWSKFYNGGAFDSSNSFQCATIRTDGGGAWRNQTAYHRNSNIEQRRAFDGAWQPWEWVNPPLHKGVEYRTTKRWKGAPVYCRLLNLGWLAAGSHSFPLEDVPITVTSMGIDIRIYNNNHEFISENGNVTGKWLGKGSEYLTLSFTLAVSHGGVDAYIEYTK